jgi:nicotinamide-nucleotide amidase
MSTAGTPLRAAIIAVGSEMLTPTRVDTNSLTVTEVLNGLGIDVAFKAVAGDHRADLDALLGHAIARYDVVILTGGLGPTADDVTRDVVASHLGLPLLEDADVLARLEQRFAARGVRMPDVNRRQAMVPSGAAVLGNPNGTAPGLWIEHRGKAIALLPGPPREMKPMMAGEVRERLLPRSGHVRLLRRVIVIAGRTESRVEEITQPTYASWLGADPAIETTILATGRHIELHLSTRVMDPAAGARALDEAVAQIVALLGPDIVSCDGRGIEQVVGDALRQRGWRIACAESCTGGLVTSMLTDVAGSSEYVERSIIAYSNRAKVELLGVAESAIAQHGAVSEPVALAMAMGVRDGAGVDVGVGITGIAGPGGGSDARPVGTVCMAVAADRVHTRTFRFPGGRSTVKTFAAVTALDLVRRVLNDLSIETDWARRR